MPLARTTLVTLLALLGACAANASQAYASNGASQFGPTFYGQQGIQQPQVSYYNQQGQTQASFAQPAVASPLPSPVVAAPPTTCPASCPASCAPQCRTACCNPKPPPRSLYLRRKEKTAVACEGHKLKIQCPNKYDRIILYSTFYGRRDNTTCKHDVIPSVGYCAQQEMNVNEKVFDLCGHATRCFVSAHNQFMAKPNTTICPGLYKYLEVTYRCSQHPHLHKTCPVPCKESANCWPSCTASCCEGTPICPETCKTTCLPSCDKRCCTPAAPPPPPPRPLAAAPLPAYRGPAGCPAACPSYCKSPCTPQCCYGPVQRPSYLQQPQQAMFAPQPQLQSFYNQQSREMNNPSQQMNSQSQQMYNPSQQMYNPSQQMYNPYMRQQASQRRTETPRSQYQNPLHSFATYQRNPQVQSPYSGYQNYARTQVSKACPGLCQYSCMPGCPSGCCSTQSA